MVAANVQLYHGSAIEASLPVLRIRYFQYSMKSLVHWAIDARVGEGTAWYMSPLVTFGAGAVLVSDSEWGNEFRTCWLSAIEAIFCGPFKGSFTEISKLLVVKDPQSNTRRYDIAAATRRV